MDPEHIEDLIEIDKATYLDEVCSALISHQDAVQHIENTLIAYFQAELRNHISYFESPKTGTVLYRVLAPKLEYEGEEPNE